jgi:hypothetical protein
MTSHRHFTARPGASVLVNPLTEAQRGHKRACPNLSPERIVPSNTKVTQYRRKLRNMNAGRKAKNYRANHGTTPVFPIHTPEADANAEAKQKG